MKLDNLIKWEYPENLQNPNGRILATAAYLLKKHGYNYLADEIKELSDELLETKPNKL